MACMAIGLGEPDLVVFLGLREVKVADEAARAEARELGNETRQITLITGTKKKSAHQKRGRARLVPDPEVIRSWIYFRVSGDLARQHRRVFLCGPPKNGLLYMLP